MKKNKLSLFLLLCASLISFSGCGVEFTDFSFFSRPSKLTLSIPSKRELKSFAPQSLPAGPPSIFPEESKSAQAVTQLKMADAYLYKPHSGHISSLIPIGEDGVISGGDDGEVLLSRFVTRNGKGEFISEVLLHGTKPILALALSPDKQLLAIAQTSLVVIFDLKERIFKYQLSRVRGRITSLGWDPRGELLGMGLAGGDIYLWSFKDTFFGGRGKDSFDSLEHYLGAESPVVAIVFHPSGGAFLSAEQEGKLSIWRALRTEEELGLRDRFNLDDQEAVSSNRNAFAHLGSAVTDTYLFEDGSYFLASSAGGRLSAWKVRGLVQQADLNLNNESLLSFSPLPTYTPKLDGLALFFVSTQDQKARAVCMKKSSNINSSSLEYVTLAETPALRETFGRIRSGKELIWVAEKADTIVAIKTASLLKQIELSPMLKECTKGIWKR